MAIRSHRAPGVDTGHKGGAPGPGAAERPGSSVMLRPLSNHWRQLFVFYRTVHDIDISIAGEPRSSSHRYKIVGRDRKESMEASMEHSTTARRKPRSSDMFSRRAAAVGALGAVLATCNTSPWTISSSRSQEQGARHMNQYASKKSISEAVDGVGLL